MKLRLLCLILTLALCVAGLCACTQQDDEKYKLVEATQEDFDNILAQLESIFAMIHDNYDYEDCENIYDLLFKHTDLDYVRPDNEKQVAEYIAQPLKIEDWGSYKYRVLVPEKDPLGRFGELVEGGYDDQGNYDPDRARNYITTDNYGKVITGHVKYSGEYIDWLIEGVWNSKVDHESYFEDADEKTKCYYHDGFYYVPEWGADRGGGVMFGVVINSIIPFEDNKYRVEFSRYDDVDRYHSSASAILGLKETKDGFRFWSIYELEQEK